MKLFSFYFYLFNLLLISNQIKASFDHNELNPLKKIKLNEHDFSAQENLFPAETSVLTENDLDSSQKTTETKFEDLNLELLLNISRFMNPKDIGSLSSCSTNLSKTLSYQPNKPGEWLRMKHPFSVKTEDRWYFLEEFLDIEERQDITKINNMNHLVQVNPSKFIKLFVKFI